MPEKLSVSCGLPVISLYPIQADTLSIIFGLPIHFCCRNTLALCGYPHAEEIVLSLKDTIQTYEEERLTLNSEIDKIISEITQLREVFQEGKE